MARKQASRSGLRRFLRENGLSLVLGVLFLMSLVGQSVAGHLEYNEDQRLHREPSVGYWGYLHSAHFLEALSENWESEFLQIFAFVLLTAMLYQKGSAESRKLDEPEPVARNPRLPYRWLSFFCSYCPLRCTPSPGPGSTAVNKWLTARHQSPW